MHNKILISVSLFALSLSFFSVRATAICYLAFAAAIITTSTRANKKIKIPRRWIIAFLSINSLVILISIRHDLYLNYYIKFFAFTTYTLLFTSTIKNKIISTSDVLFSCNALIATHMAFFFVQLTTYQLTGKYINFDSYIREVASEALYQSRALENLRISIRATGLFSEPSFYAMTILPTSLLMILHQRKITVLTALGMISVLASLSIAAIAISILAFTLIFFTIKSNKVYYASMVLILALASPIIMEVYEERIINSADYDAIYSRQLVFQEFQARGEINNLLGSGFFWDERYPIGETMLNGYHTRDSSFYINTYFTSGILGLIALASSLIMLFRKAPKYAVALAIILLFKVHVISGSLWLCLILIYSFSNAEKINPLSDLDKKQNQNPKLI